MTGTVLSLNRPVGALVVRAQRMLGMTHEAFGTALGASKRTAARWAAGSASLSVPQVRDLACLVYAEDPELAAELAGAASTTVDALGLVAPPAPIVATPPFPEPVVVLAPPPPLPPPPLPTALVVDAVVCAAADATQVTPAAVRATLLAAFRRARELRLTVEDVETALAANVVSLSR